MHLEGMEVNEGSYWMKLTLEENGGCTGITSIDLFVISNFIATGTVCGMKVSSELVPACEKVEAKEYGVVVVHLHAPARTYVLAR